MTRFPILPAYHHHNNNNHHDHDDYHPQQSSSSSPSPFSSETTTNSSTIQTTQQLLVILLSLICMGAALGFERSLLPRMAVDVWNVHSTTTILQLVSSFGASKAFANIMAGPFADRFGRKPTLVLGFVVGLPVMPFVNLPQTTWNEISIMNIAFGFSQGLLGSSLFFLLIDVMGPTRRGIAVGVGECTIYVTTALINLLAGDLATHYGYRPIPFWVATFFAIVGLASTIPLKDTLDQVQAEQDQQLNTLLKNRNHNKSKTKTTKRRQQRKNSDNSSPGLPSVIEVSSPRQQQQQQPQRSQAEADWPDSEHGYTTTMTTDENNNGTLVERSSTLSFLTLPSVTPVTPFSHDNEDLLIQSPPPQHSMISSPSSSSTTLQLSPPPPPPPPPPPLDDNDDDEYNHYFDDYGSTSSATSDEEDENDNFNKEYWDETLRKKIQTMNLLPSGGGLMSACHRGGGGACGIMTNDQERRLLPHQAFAEAVAADAANLRDEYYCTHQEEEEEEAEADDIMVNERTPLVFQTTTTTTTTNNKDSYKAAAAANYFSDGDENNEDDDDDVDDDWESTSHHPEEIEPEELDKIEHDVKTMYPSALPLLINILQTNPNYVLLCLSGMAMNFKDGFAWGSFPLFFSNFHRLSDAHTDLLVAIYPLCWGIAQAFTGALSDLLGRRLFLLGGFGACMVGTALFSVPGFVWGRPASDNPHHIAVWIVADVLLGLGTAMAYPALQAAVADEILPVHRGLGLGFYRFVRDMGYVVGALICGSLTDSLGYPATFLIVSGVLGVSFLSLVSFYEPLKLK